MRQADGRRRGSRLRAGWQVNGAVYSALMELAEAATAWRDARAAYHDDESMHSNETLPAYVLSQLDLEKAVAAYDRIALAHLTAEMKR
jgi:hypothetical protein